MFSYFNEYLFGAASTPEEIQLADAKTDFHEEEDDSWVVLNEKSMQNVGATTVPDCSPHHASQSGKPVPSDTRQTDKSTATRTSAAAVLCRASRKTVSPKARPSVSYSRLPAYRVTVRAARRGGKGAIFQPAARNTFRRGN